LLEVAPYDVNEWFYRNIHAVLESIGIVKGHHTRVHIPLVGPSVLVITLDVRLRYVILTEYTIVHLWIFIPYRLIWIEAERCMIPDGPSYSFVNVGFD